MGGKWAICWYDSRIRRCGAGDSGSVLWDKRRKHPGYRLKTEFSMELFERNVSFH